MHQTLHILTLIALSASCSLHSAPPTILGTKPLCIQTHSHSQNNRNDNTTPTEQINCAWDQAFVSKTPERNSCSNLSPSKTPFQLQEHIFGLQPMMTFLHPIIIDCSNICTKFQSIHVITDSTSQGYMDERSFNITKKTHLIHIPSQFVPENTSLRIYAETQKGLYIQCVKILKNETAYLYHQPKIKHIVAELSWTKNNDDKKLLKITLFVK